MYSIELQEWGDGTVRLAFWDAQGGQDTIFTLNDDGSVLASLPFRDGEEQFAPVDDLVQELLLLARQGPKGKGDV